MQKTSHGLGRAAETVFPCQRGAGRIGRLPITENAEERILIVSHGTTLSFLQSMIMGYRFEDIARFRFSGSGGSVSKFILEPNGKTVACYINQRWC